MSKYINSNTMPILNIIILFLLLETFLNNNINTNKKVIYNNLYIPRKTILLYDNSKKYSTKKLSIKL